MSRIRGWAYRYVRYRSCFESWFGFTFHTVSLSQFWQLKLIIVHFEWLQSTIDYTLVLIFRFGNIFWYCRFEHWASLSTIVYNAHQWSVHFKQARAKSWMPKRAQAAPPARSSFTTGRTCRQSVGSHEEPFECPPNLWYFLYFLRNWWRKTRGALFCRW